jgi:hypothetical protein
MAIGKISYITKEQGPDMGKSIQSSLLQLGYNRIPNSYITLTIYKERDGRYRTGLDPEANYIKFMSEEDAAQEIARVTALKEQLEKTSGIPDLSPRSDFYRGMFNPDPSIPRVTSARLKGETNTFNLNDPFEAITYAWLRVHPEVAPSHDAYTRGEANPRCPAPMNCFFYVQDEDRETIVAFQYNSLLNKCVGILDTMNTSKRYKVARLLSLPVTFRDNEQKVYVILDRFIKEIPKRNKMENINLFIRMCEMTEENLQIRFLVKEALRLNVYRLYKGELFEGKTRLAKNEEERVIDLSTINRHEELLALEEKVKQARAKELV